MRFPNGYGSVVNLGKKRRKPYAVRITYDYIFKDGKCTQKYKYLGYFEKSKEAHEFLAKYNAGLQVKEHISLVKQPTFSDVFEEWLNYKINLKSSISDSTIKNYNLAFGWCSDLQNKKIASIRLADLQNVVNKYKNKSRSTVMTIKTVLMQMYEYAIKHEYIEKNYATLVDYEHIEQIEEMHKSFTDDEIELLWNNRNIFGVDYILIMVYTGVRASEFLTIENEKIDLNRKYFICGMKTSNGMNRTIPINNKILPIIEKYYDIDKKYLITNTKGNKYAYGVFNVSVWKPVMQKLGLDHTPHDTRHTLATLLDRAGANKVCIKKIMGHSIADMTERVYTHKSLEDLLEAINLI